MGTRLDSYNPVKQRLERCKLREDCIIKWLVWSTRYGESVLLVIIEDQIVGTRLDS